MYTGTTVLCVDNYSILLHVQKIVDQRVANCYVRVVCTRFLHCLSTTMNYPEAGPSNTQSSSSKAAPSHPLPSRAFYSVEFPGYVKETSVPQAVKHIGGQETLNRIFNPNATKPDMLLDLNWRPDNPFSHPISGGVIVSHGILLKVVKKRRKRKEGAAEGEQPQGEFTAEAVGIIPRTARFRSTCFRAFLNQTSSIDLG